MLAVVSFLASPIGKIIGGAVSAIAIIAIFLIWLAAHDSNIRHNALKGYVQQSQLDAANAKLAEIQRQKNVAETALSDFQKQKIEDQRAQAAKDAQEDEKYEKELKAAGRAWILERPDIDHIMR